MSQDPSAASLQVYESGGEGDTSDMEDVSSDGMHTFMSPTKRDSLDEGYDPNEVLKVIVYDDEKIEIRPGNLAEDDDDDDVDEGQARYDPGHASDAATPRESQELSIACTEEEMSSQDTYFYPSKFGLCRDYEDPESGEVSKVALKPIQINTPSPELVLNARRNTDIPGPPQYLARGQTLDVPQIEVSGYEGESLPKKIRSGSVIPEAVKYVGRYEDGSTVQVEIHTEPLQTSKAAKKHRVTFNIPDPIVYVERESVRNSSRNEDEIQLSGEDEESKSEVESDEERKKFRPTSARTRVTSPLPEPVDYLTRRESDQSTREVRIVTPSSEGIPGPVTYLTRQEKILRLQKVASTGSTESDMAVFKEIMRAVEMSATSIDSDEVYNEIMKTFAQPQVSIDSMDVYNEIMKAIQPFTIPEPAKYLTREEKLRRLRQITTTDSKDSDQLVYNELMKPQFSLDSGTSLDQRIKGLERQDVNEIYNTIRGKGGAKGRDDILAARGEFVDLVPPDMLTFQDFMSSHNTSAKTETPPSLTGRGASSDSSANKSSSDSTARRPLLNGSVDIPDNPVPSPVHYPSSQANFESFTPIMVDGKLRKGAAKAMQKLRQHCSSKVHPCDCPGVSFSILFL